MAPTFFYRRQVVGWTYPRGPVEPPLFSLVHLPRGGGTHQGTSVNPKVLCFISVFLVRPPVARQTLPTRIPLGDESGQVGGRVLSLAQLLADLHFTMSFAEDLPQEKTSISRYPQSLGNER